MRMERSSVMMGAGKKLCAVFAAAIVILFCGSQTARADAADLFDAGDVHRIDIMLSDEDSVFQNKERFHHTKDAGPEGPASFVTLYVCRETVFILSRPFDFLKPSITWPPC